jgi:TolB-like protein
MAHIVRNRARLAVLPFGPSDGLTDQLIESPDETHLWAKTFDRVVTDALSVQTEVAEEIARAVAQALALAP